MREFWALRKREQFVFRISVLVAVTLPSYVHGQMLDEAEIIKIDIQANDIVYDRTRNLIYATVGSDGGANGNTITMIDPATLDIVDNLFIGSEPNQIVISNDDSRVYIGIDGARAFRYWEPGTGTVGPLVPIFDDDDPAIAEDMAVSPSDPSVVVVSKDKVGTTADGDLEIFNDNGSIGFSDKFSSGANSISFLNASTFISYNNSNTGFDLKRWSFDGSNLIFEDEVGELVAGFSARIETSDGLVYAESGMVADPLTLTGLGTFPASGALEPISVDQTTYFFSSRTLRLLDNVTFLEFDSITFKSSIAPFIEELVLAGSNRLAYAGTNGEVGIITMIPATDTGPSDYLVEQFNIVRGRQIGGGLQELAASDDAYLQMNAGKTLSDDEPPVWLEFESTSPVESPADFEFAIEANVNIVGITQTIELFDFDNGQYEEVDVRVATTKDSVTSIAATVDLSRFIESGSGTIRTRIGWKAGGPIFLFPWTANIDHVFWTITP